MLAAVCSWHEHHTTALAELEGRLAVGETMVVAGPTLVEAYAVLTRLPAPYRLSPADAHALIGGNFVDGREIAVLDATQYTDLLGRALAWGVAGGQIYDAVIGACARGAKVDTLITFNERHFRRVVDPGTTIVVPGEEPAPAMYIWNR